MIEHELDRRLDDTLRAVFAPPAAGAFVAYAERAAGRTRRVPFWPWLIAAAALLVVGVLLATWPRVRGPEGHDGRELGAMWAAAYQDAVAQGFGGVGCCKMGLNLHAECKQRFSCGLSLVRNTEMELLGTYSGRPTGGAMTLLASMAGAPVCVNVVPQHHAPDVTLPSDSGLHLARREVGDLVLFAVSKAPGADALQSFVLP